MRAAGWTRDRRNRVMAALIAPEGELEKQGFEPLDTTTQAEVTALAEGVSTWQEWVKLRTMAERNLSQSTIRNWESKLRGLAEWLGHDNVGVMDRKQAFEYKLHLMTSLKELTVLQYIGSFNGLWNWAIRSGQIKGENIWTGLKKGLSSESGKEPLDPVALRQAELKADQLEDIRFWFGRYQGLRKEDYCGLRWR